MRLSAYYIPTLKEAPGDAEVVSHKLLVRAGMIRKLTSGIYTYLPAGLRALERIAAVVREEMNAAGAMEILMPMVQPGDLWRETGRWELYGRELLRFKDRHDRDYCLGPTHEEVVTALLRGEVKSYRQLPLNVYQIQTKFRDEIRPRFGLMRGREFIMKDAYSFDKDEAGAEASYQAMYEAYSRIFTRLGLRFRAVQADSGAIGGSYSHEFMVLAETGEDVIAVCNACDYAANLEKAAVALPDERPAPCDEDCAPLEEVATPGMHTVAEVARFLEMPESRILKTLLFDADGAPVAVLLRGDRELNEIKLANFLDAKSLQLASPEQVEAWTGAPVGFAGPVGLKVDAIYADKEVLLDSGWAAGANRKDAHVLHVDVRRDVTLAGEGDFGMVTTKDRCPACGGGLSLPRGIEVGHVFKLGSKYSEAMEAVFLDEQGKTRHMVMGCYGVGVSRILAACIEQNHDDHGAVLPPAVAPWEAALLALGAAKDAGVAAKADELYETLTAQGVATLYDDRDDRPGVKFNDADLLGLPIQVVVGGKALARGVLEVKDRRTGEKAELPVDTFAEAFAAFREDVLRGWRERPVLES